jgi:Uma2 family endonuclease
MPSVVFHVVDPPEGTTVPAWVHDLPSFSRWCESAEFPETGRISYIQGDVWMDMSLEELFLHNQLKVEVTTFFRSLVKAEPIGYIFGDRARVRNKAADLSIEPDAVFVSFDAIRSGRAAMSEGIEAGVIYLDGTPDVVLEVVSLSSVRKDTVDLRTGYFDAGVPEYWLIDARAEPISFEILKRGSRGYTTTRAQAGGWLKSNVLGKTVRIKRATDPLGNPQFILEHRA